MRSVITILFILLQISQLDAKQSRMSSRNFNKAKSKVDSGSMYTLRNLKKSGFKSLEDVYKLYAEVSTEKWTQPHFQEASRHLSGIISSYKRKSKKLDWSRLERRLEEWQKVSLPEIQPEKEEEESFEKDGDKLSAKNGGLAIEKYLAAIENNSDKELLSSRIYVKIAEIYNTKSSDSYNINSALSFYMKAIEWEKRNRKKVKLGTRIYKNFENRRLSHSLYKIGEIYEEQKNYARAIKFYREGFAQDDFEAAFKVGDFYLTGKFLNLKDPKGSIRFYEKGVELLNKSGFAKGKYVDYYLKLAQLKYKFGPHDRELVKFLKQCCDLRLGEAAFYLGSLYTKGKPVKKDLNAAYAWYTLSDKMGYHDAAETLLSLQKKLEGHKETYAKLYAKNFVKDWQKERKKRK